MKIMKATPISVVREIEPCLAFWVDGLGYAKTMEVPHDGKIGFIILTRDDSEIMLQTMDSLKADLPAVAALVSEGSTIIYMNVSSITEVRESVDPTNIVVPPRKTFYGADEIFARDPHSGQIVGFAEFSG